MAKRYSVNDGKLVLTLEPMEEGGYIVRCPTDPEVITSADDVAEAFRNAYDAIAALRASRKKWLKQMRLAKAG